MFNALTRAGENQQVIIFTCRSRTCETLGGRRLSSGYGLRPIASPQATALNAPGSSFHWFVFCGRLHGSEA